MDQNEKSYNDKITKLENEIKVLKNEVQAVLLDLRESYLNMENPFNSTADPTTIPPIVITERTSNSRLSPEPAHAENHRPEPGKVESKILPENPFPPVSDIETAIRATKTIPNSNSVNKATPDKQGDPSFPQNNKLDILTVAGLVKWAEESTQKLGKERSIAVLEMSQTMGNLSEDIKPIVVKLIGLVPDSTTENQPRPKALLGSLMKLNRLLSHSNIEQIAMELLLNESGDITNG